MANPCNAMAASSEIPVVDPNAFLTNYAQQSTTGCLKDSAGRYPESNFANVISLRQSANQIRFPLPVHRQTQYSLLLLTTGHITVTSGLETYLLGAGDLIFLPGRQIVSARQPSDALNGYYVLFDVDYLLAQLRQPAQLTDLPFFRLDDKPLVTLQLPALAYVTDLLEKARTELGEGGPDHQPIVVALLQLVFFECKKYHVSAYADEEQRRAGLAAAALTQQFKRLLLARVSTLRSVQGYALELAVTPNHLNKAVRQTTSQTAKQLISQQLLLEAKVLLRQTNQSVSEISYALSFSDVGNFCRVFKKAVGHGPSDYRRSYEDSAQVD